MSDTPLDQSKRRFLLAATGLAGATAVAGIATPFIASLTPSAKAKAAGAPVEVDISHLEPGQMIRTVWQGKVVWVINRSPEMMDSLAKVDVTHLTDPNSENADQQPEYCRNPTRSLAEHKNILVLIGICTHLGCSPTDKMQIGAASGMGDEWKGGFYCPCHGSKFDLAGRVFKNVPAPKNLEVPMHKYLSATRILVGSDGKGA